MLFFIVRNLNPTVTFLLNSNFRKGNLKPLVVILSVLIAIIQCDNSVQAWSISGNCSEPEPIINTYNDIESNRIIYSCFPGTTHDSGHLEITCDPSGPDPEYVGEWPHCSTQCGKPINWERAPMSNLSGTLADDYVIYECAHGNGTDTIAFCTEANGWEMVYPVCINSTNWAEEMIRATSLGFGNISDDSCFYVQNETDRPWISVMASDSNFLLDIIFIGAEISGNLDNKWMNKVSASFWRDSTLVAEVDASVLPGNETDKFSLHLDNYIMAVNEVRLTSNEANFIGACRFEIFGQITETGCPELAIPPFKTRVQQYVSQDTVLLECDNGYIYIGGHREMECTYNRVWEITHSVFIECSDRRNYAINCDFTVNIQYGNSYNTLFEGNYSGDDIQNSGIFATISSNSEDVEIVVKLENKVAIERVVLECDGHRVPRTVSVSNTTDFSAQKNCLESISHAYGKSHVFFCGVHPVGRFVKIGIIAQQAISESWNISHLTIIGIEIQNEVVPECSIEPNGQDYKGFLNYTIDGSVCYYWSDHLQYSDLERFPDETLDDAQNFCRNPDPSRFSRPFCITGNGAVPCLVPPCLAICAMNTRGDDYLGHFNIARNGANCLNWADNSLPFVRDRDFPDLSLESASNYCRNPALSQMKPWCYVSSSPPRSRRCFIPSCPFSDIEIAPHQMTHDEAKSLIQNGSNVARFFTFPESTGTQTELEQVEAAWMDSQCASYHNLFLLYLFIEQEGDKWNSKWRHTNISCSDTKSTTLSQNSALNALAANGFTLSQNITTNPANLTLNISNWGHNNNYSTGNIATDAHHSVATTVTTNTPGVFTASINPPVSGTTMNFTVTASIGTNTQVLVTNATNHPPLSTTSAAIPSVSATPATASSETVTHTVNPPILVLNTTNNLPPASSVMTGTMLPIPVINSTHSSVSITNLINSPVAVTTATNHSVAVINTTSHQTVSGTITTIPSGPNTFTTNHPGSHNVTTNPAVTYTVTTNPPGTGAATTNHPGTEAFTINHTGTGAVITYPPGTEAVTSNPPGTGPVATNPPGTGAITTNPPGTGPVTTNPPGTEAVITNPPGTWAVTTNHPVTGAVTSHAPGTGPVATNAPLTGAVTTNHLGTGADTNNPPGTGVVATNHPETETVTTHHPGTGAVTTNPSGTGAVATDPPGTGTVTTNPSGTGAFTTNHPGTGVVTNNSPGTGVVTTNSPLTGAVTTNPLLTGAVTTNPPLTVAVTTTGAVTTNHQGTGAVATSPSLIGTVTTNPPGTGTITTNPPVSGTNTTNLPVSGTATTSFPVSSTNITNLPVSGITTTNPLLSDTTTTIFSVSGTTTTIPPISDTSTSNLLVSSTTNLSPSDTSTTSPSSSGTSTTNIPVSGTGTTSLPVSGTTTNNILVSVTNTTDYPVSVSSTTDSTVSTQSIATCECECSHNNINITSEKLETLIEEIKSNLMVNKEELSATKRAKTSAVDSRPSAVATGFVGVAMLVTTAFMIATPDALTLLTHIYRRSK